jgi:transcriptional regulator with XRE-family HTH domain
MTRGRRARPRVLPSTQTSADFAARLVRLVKIYGRSVSALAHQIGRSEGALRKWLRGKSEPTLSDSRELCEVAGISLEWLATGHGSVFAGADLLDYIAYTLVGKASGRWRDFSRDRREEMRATAHDVVRGWIERELYVKGERHDL